MQGNAETRLIFAEAILLLFLTILQFRGLCRMLEKKKTKEKTKQDVKLLKDY